MHAIWDGVEEISSHIKILHTSFYSQYVEQVHVVVFVIILSSKLILYIHERKELPLIAWHKHSTETIFHVHATHRQ
jgi:hypothetical protein